TQDRRKRLGARLWDGDPTHQSSDLGVLGNGPVGFLADGNPAQLVVDPEHQDLILMNLARREVLHRFDIPGTLAIDDRDSPPPVAMTPDAARIAAAIRSADGTPSVRIWDGRTGKQLFSLPGQASALALSPDGALLATGDDRGRIRIGTLASG